MISGAFESLRFQPADRVRFWTMYRNARRRGMGCARACYVVFYVLDFSVPSIAEAMGRSRYTIESQVRDAKRDLRSGGTPVRGKGDLASLLTLDVPRARRRKPVKGRNDHPLRRRSVDSDPP